MPSPPTQKTVRQHYVARAYLKNFTNPNGKLWVYGKKFGKVRASGPWGVAYEEGFYDLEPGSLVDEAAEKWNAEDLGEKTMTRLEELHRPAIEYLLTKGVTDGITPTLRLFLSDVMAVQYHRTVLRRKLIDQMVSSFATGISDELVALNFPDAGRGTVAASLTGAALRQLHIQQIIDPEVRRRFKDAILGHHWAICVAPPGGAAFITSDNPVSRRPHLAHRGRTYCGFKSQGIEIFYPVTAGCGILIRERCFHTPDSALDGLPTVVGSAEVHRLNKIVAGNCDRFVFGNDPAFKTVDRFFGSNPNLRTVTWERFATRAGKLRGNKKEGAFGEKRQRFESYIDYEPVRWDG